MRLRLFLPLLLMFDSSACKQRAALYCDEERPCESEERPFCDINGDHPASEGIGNTCIPDPFPDGGLGLPEISIADVEVIEGDYGVTRADFEVKLSRESSRLVSVDFATSDGTSTEEEGDYSGEVGTIVIEPGESFATIEVEVTADRLSEPDETLVVALAGPRNATIARGEAVASIADDDRGFDMNGDGFADLVVGDYRTTVGEETMAGEAYVFFGGPTGLPPSLSSQDADVIVSGAASGDNLGGSLSSGNVNGDQFDDLIVGDSEARYVFLGSAEAAGRLTRNDADLVLETGGNVGTADANGDGVADILVASADGAFVFFGAHDLPGSLGEVDADVKFVSAGGNAGFDRIKNAGDFNGDGIEDVLVAASRDDQTAPDSGAAFLFFGAAGLSGTIDTTEADVRFLGPNVEGARFGTRIGGKLDIDGDGLDEILIAAPNHDLNGNGEDDGSVYVFKGREDPSDTLLVSDADIIIEGEQGGRLGASLGAAGDLDGDGFGDFVVGESAAPPDHTGAAYVFYGFAALTGELTIADASVTLSGAASNDYFGSCASVPFDIDTSGFHDLAVGASFGGALDNGAAYLFLGEESRLSSTTASGADVVVEGEEDNGFFGGHLR